MCRGKPNVIKAISFLSPTSRMDLFIILVTMIDGVSIFALAKKGEEDRDHANA